MNELTDNNIPYKNVSLHNGLYEYLYQNEEGEYLKLVSNTLENLNAKVEAETGSELEVFEYPFLDLTYDTLYADYIKRFPRFLDKHSDSNFSAINRVIAYQLFCFRNASWIQSLFRDLNRPIKIWKTQNKAYTFDFNVIVDLPNLKDVQCNIYRNNASDNSKDLVKSNTWSWSNSDDTSYFDSLEFNNDNFFKVSNNDEIIPNYSIVVNARDFDDHYLIKGYPENDTENGDIYDHDYALDNLGDLLNVKRLSFNTDFDSGQLAETYPPYHDLETEPDYWFENRIREYITNYQNDNNSAWYSLPLAEIIKRYRVNDSYLANRKRQICHMTDNTKSEETLITASLDAGTAYIIGDDIGITAKLTTAEGNVITGGLVELYDEGDYIASGKTNGAGVVNFNVENPASGVRNYLVNFIGEVYPDTELTSNIIYFELPSDLTKGDYLFTVSYEYSVDDDETKTNTERIYITIDDEIIIHNSRYSLGTDFITGNLLFTPYSDSLEVKFTNSTYQKSNYTLPDAVVSKNRINTVTLSMDKETVEIGDEVTFTIDTDLKDDLTVQLIDNNTYTVLGETTINQTASLKYTFTENGFYNIMAKILGDKQYYGAQSNSINIDLSKGAKSTFINLNSYDVTEITGSTYSISGYLLTGSTGVNNKNIYLYEGETVVAGTVTDSNGYFKIDITASNGIHNYTTKFEGDDDYTASSIDLNPITSYLVYDTASEDKSSSLFSSSISLRGSGTATVSWESADYGYKVLHNKSNTESILPINLPENLDLNGRYTVEWDSYLDYGNNSSGSEGLAIYQASSDNNVAILTDNGTRQFWERFGTSMEHAYSVKADEYCEDSWMHSKFIIDFDATDDSGNVVGSFSVDKNWADETDYFDVEVPLNGTSPEGYSYDVLSNLTSSSILGIDSEWADGSFTFYKNISILKE